MPGTGIHGYTGPALYGGSYNISNGIITSGSAPTYNTTSSGNRIVNSNAGYEGSNNVSGSTSELVSGIIDAIYNAAHTAQNNVYNNTYGITNEGLADYANTISDIASRSDSNYAKMVREILANQDANTAKSQAFAREQMDYQTRSDKAAMTWSAQEAQKNRDWQERLSNTAHQREVKDLLKAGLNPILSANAGAFTGSGATGQGFSSSGAMGNVDTSGTSTLGSLFSTVMNTASQAMIAGMYTNAEKYAADQNYAASKLASEASIYNNQNSVSAQKAIAQMNNENEIQRANINAAASKYSADSSLAGSRAVAGATSYAAETSAAASKYRADQDYKIAQLNSDTSKWLQEHNINNDPVGYGIDTAKGLIEVAGEVLGKPTPSTYTRPSNSSLFKPWEQ